MDSILRIDAPSSEDIASFHRDGYIAFSDVLTDAGREGLIDEVVNYGPVGEFLRISEEERGKLDPQYRYSVRPWNDRGPWSDSLIDAPLVTNLLKSTIGPDYHFCHSAMNLASRGAKKVGFHQDHHHWRHSNPVNLAEREKYYIQLLYYPNGFKAGDRSLSVIPGSHLVSPTEEVTPERLLAGEFNDQLGRELELKGLEMPPGSMVYINARMFHGVDAKPVDSPQEYRIFTIDIFKEAGPPHRHTQEIPAKWMEKASPYRKRLFEREAYSPECWK